MQHQCNLAAKESGLECTCVNNDDFTVLVSGGDRRHWVSMCIVWPSHSKWLREQSNESASDFALSLNIPPWKLFWWFRRPQLWAAGDWQLHHNNAPAHASRLVQSDLVKHQITQVTQLPYSPDLVSWDLWLFTKLKSPLKGKRFQTVHEIQANMTGQQLIAIPTKDFADCFEQWKRCWEKHVRSQGAYFEGDWGIIVLWIMFLVPCIFSKCLYFSYYLAVNFLDRPHVTIKLLNQWLTTLPQRTH